MICPAGKVSCLHYGGDHTDRCELYPGDARLITGYEHCPWPSKIQLDPWEEITEGLDRLSYNYRNAHSQRLDGYSFSEEAIKIIKKHIPKGDIDKALEAFRVGGSESDGWVITKANFKLALKIGGF